MATEWQERMRSVGYLSRGRSRTREVASGREHPDSGKPFSTREDEAGNRVTEHGEQGSGVSERQDVEIRPEPVTRKMLLQ